MRAVCRKRSAAAAGAEYDDEGKNDDPSAVIVEKMAKAVIHNVPPSRLRDDDL